MTSSVKDREPIDSLNLRDLKNRQFFVFVEMQNCEEASIFSFQITTANGVIKQSFKVPKCLRYRTFHAFKTEADVKKIEIIDCLGHKVGRGLTAVIKQKLPQKLANKPKTKPKRKAHSREIMGVKKLLQSMQG